MTSNHPELTIIIPVLNDAVELRELLGCLAEQTGVSFEVILCDGGSSQDIPGLAATWALHASFPLRVISTGRGRGTQMNAGAAAAAGNLLLFLHADSQFTCRTALFSGVTAFKNHPLYSSATCAARFRLHFRRKGPEPSLAYFFHEAKARINRGSCIRGDQGYLMDRSTFERLGRFDCSLPFLEDVHLATRLAEQGDWILLPATISTSARRFEQEGFFERQVANVIIVNAIETGWTELLAALPGLYRCSSTSGRLSLFPLLKGVHTMICSNKAAWQSSFWRATGFHVASNAWQLFFWLDVRRTFRSGEEADAVTPFWLNIYDRWLKAMFQSRSAAGLAERLTRGWLWWMLRVTGKQNVS